MSKKVKGFQYAVLFINGTYYLLDRYRSLDQAEELRLMRSWRGAIKRHLADVSKAGAKFKIDILDHNSYTTLLTMSCRGGDLPNYKECFSEIEYENILHLTLKKAPFDVMITGEKQLEFRESSRWIKNRLFKGGKIGRGLRDYDVVKFVNGYGADKPYFIAEFESARVLDIDFDHKYSNGLQVRARKGDIVICLGKVLKKGNIKE